MFIADSQNSIIQTQFDVTINIVENYLRVFQNVQEVPLFAFTRPFAGMLPVASVN